MTAFKGLLIKEWREVVRSYKILWIPIVFILLGVSDPLTNYYMEDLFKLVGNIPEGLAQIMPQYTPYEIIALSAGQFQLIGLIVLVAAFIGTVSRERKNGTAALIYVRPIKSYQLILSKWLVASFIGIISAVAGFISSLYYTVILFGEVDYGAFLQTVGIYCLWIMLCMALVVMLSASFDTVIAATIAFILTQLGQYLDSFLDIFGTYSPYKLSNYGLSLLNQPVESSTLTITIIISFILTVLFLLIGSYTSKLNWTKVKL